MAAEKVDSPILISLKTFSSQGTGLLKSALLQLSQEFLLVDLSSVYKVDRPAESLAGLRDIRKEERLDGYAIVIRARTQFSPQETLDILTQIELDLQREVLRRSVSLNLLVYNSEIIMLPGLSLPHPEMHLRPEEVVPAVEVWADYVHPVLKEPLRQLSRRFAHDNWGEFFERIEMNFFKTEETK